VPNPRKNVGGLLDAYERLVEHWPAAPTLVLAGGVSEAARPWIDRVQSGRLRGRVDVRGYVADPDRIALYRGAALLVLPSFDEGFGLPALEAMALGVPVIVSDRGALPEVVGAAGLVAEPDDPGAWRAQMHRVLTTPHVAATMRADGLARSRQFNWQESARRLLGALAQRCPAPERVR